MARDERKRQEALLRKKRRREEKRAALSRPDSRGFPLKMIPLSPVEARRALISSARDLPIHECVTRADMEEQGLSPFLITRMQPDGNLVLASFLVDLYCLGVKDAAANAEISVLEYERRIKPRFFEAQARLMEPLLFHQIIYGAIDYAASLGFSPHPDFKLASLVLEPRSSVPPNPDLRFGKDGKPLFIGGPRDDVASILSTLERNVGRGNFHYIIRMGDSGALGDGGPLDVRRRRPMTS